MSEADAALGADDERVHRFDPDVWSWNEFIIWNEFMFGASTACCGVMPWRRTLLMICTSCTRQGPSLS